MGRITTHVLDTVQGGPAQGVRIDLRKLDSDDTPRFIVTVQTNRDGRSDQPLLEGAALAVGRYELVFHIGAYFSACGVALATPPFLDVIPIRFGIANADLHYHVPLLVSPWSYSTYRGS